MISFIFIGHIYCIYIYIVTKIFRNACTMCVGKVNRVKYDSEIDTDDLV